MTAKTKTFGLILLSFALVGAVLATVLLGTSVPVTAAAAVYPAEDVGTPSGDFCMVNGASVRYTEGTTGLRFKAYLSKEKYAELTAAGNTVTFGMVILPYAYQAANAVGEDTLFGADAVYCYGGAQAGKTQVLNYECEPTREENGVYGDAYYYSCAMVNIKQENYSREFFAVGYYILENSGGTTYVFTPANETNRRSVAYAAKSALDNETLTTAQKAVLQSFAFAGDEALVFNDAVTAEETITLDNLKSGHWYTVTGGEYGSTMKLSHYKNGKLYDIVQEDGSYTKVKTFDQSQTLKFLAAPVDFDEIRLVFGKSAENIKINEVKNVEIAAAPAKNQMTVGQIFDFGAKLNGLDGEVITWSSSDPTVATVSAAGRVAALKTGKTEITATVQANGETYEGYFELYIVHQTLANDRYGLVLDESPADFTLNIPAGEKIRILQLSDPQVMDMAQIREGTSLAQVQQNRWNSADAFDTNCNLYIETVFEKLQKANQLPHLVVLQGDNTYGKFDDNGTYLDKLIAEMEKMSKEYGVYWTFVFGNHDKESDIGIEEMLRRYSRAEHCLYAYRDVTGDSNFSIALKQDGEYKKLIFMFDTNSTGANRVDEYALIYQGLYDSQIDWYESTAQAFDLFAGKEVSSFAYMHIAFAEMAQTLLERYGVDCSKEKFTDYVIEYNPYGDFGSFHEWFNPWGDGTTPARRDFFAKLKANGTDGVFFGHSHQNNASLMIDGIRCTYGNKTGTYDEFYAGQLGGTLVTLSDGAFDVEHVYAVDKNHETFDFSQLMQSNATKNASTLPTEWSDGGLIGELVVQEGTDKALKLTNHSDNSTFVLVRMPACVKGNTYRVTYTIEYSVEGIAGQARLQERGNDDGPVSQTVHQTDGTYSYVFRARESGAQTYLYIWFWNWSQGDYVVLDDVIFEEIAPVKANDGILGVSEGLASVNNPADEENKTFEDTVTVEYVSDMTAALGATAYRVWMHFSNIFEGYTYLAESDDYAVHFNTTKLAELHNLLDQLRRGGVYDFIAATSSYLEPGLDSSEQALGAWNEDGVWHHTTQNVVPDPETEKDAYAHFLKLYAACWKAIAKEFPEIRYFEPANEPDVLNGQNLHKTGYDWSKVNVKENGEYVNKPYMYTDSQSARIVADMCYVVHLTTRGVNRANQVLLPGLCAYNKTADYLGYVYSAIKKGETLSGDTDPDHYFQILNWHPYIMSGDLGASAMDETWLALQKAIYKVAQDNGDDGKPVWFTEIGFSDRGIAANEEANVANMRKFLDYLTNKDGEGLTFVQTALLFRIVNQPLLTDNAYEANIGLFHAQSEDTSVAGAPKDMTLELFRYFHGEDADVSVLYTYTANKQYYLTFDKVENSDGTFEDPKTDGTFDTAGIVSLYQADNVPAEGAEGYGWASDDLFRFVLNEGNTSVRVTGVGTHSYDYLYVKFDQSVKEGEAYRITMDLQWLGADLSGGSFGYFVLTPQAKISDVISGYRALSGADLFKTGVTFDFTSNGDYDHFYLLLRENNADFHFDFTIDNVTLTRLYTRYTLEEGVTVIGNRDSEITDANAAPVATSKATFLTEKEGKVHVTSDGTAYGSYVFVRFDTTVVKGDTYTIDFALSGDGLPNFYSLDVGANQAQSIRGYTGMSASTTSVSFTATADYDFFYLRFHINNSSDLFDFVIESLSLTVTPRPAWTNDDGTFEGVYGDVTLLDGYAANGLYGYGWSRQITFATEKDGDNTVVRVTSAGSSDWSVMYVRFDLPVVSGKSYLVTFKGVSQMDAATKCFYSVDDLTGTQKVITSNGYTETTFANLFGSDGAAVAFTATSSADGFMLRIVNNAGVGFDFTLDDVKAEEVELSHQLDDGITVYSNKNAEITNADATWSTARTTYLTSAEDGVNVSSAGATSRSFVFIKFDTPLVKDKTYTVTFTLTGDSIPAYYSIDTGSNQTQLKLKNRSNAYYTYTSGVSSIVFTAESAADGFYLRFMSEAAHPFAFLLKDVGVQVTETSHILSEGVTVLSNDNSEITNSSAVGGKAAILTETDGKVHVSSVGTAYSSFLFVKFAEPVVTGNTYTIDFALSGDGLPTHYSLDVGENQAQSIREYTGMSASTTSIAFTATADYDFFYLRFHVSSTSATFDFTIESLSLRVKYLRYEVADGITAVSNRDSEIKDTNAVYSNAKSAYFTVAGGKLKVVSDTGSGNSFAFIRFDTAVVTGNVYTISLALSGDGLPTHYSLDVGANQAQSIKGYTGMSASTTSIAFTATADYDYFYLRFHNNASGAFDFTLDGISLTVTRDAWKNDDGTFEGQGGTINLYSPEELPGCYSNNWYTPLTFATVEDNGNTSVKVTTNGTRWKLLFIKFKVKIEEGKTYKITFDMTCLDEELPATEYGYFVFDDTATGTGSSDSIKYYTKISSNANLFKQGAEIQFTAGKGSEECCYLVIRGAQAANFNFTIDNISLTEVTA